MFILPHKLSTYRDLCSEPVLLEMKVLPVKSPEKKVVAKKWASQDISQKGVAKCPQLTI